MKLVNTTTVPDATLKQVIKYCLPKGLCLNDVNAIDFGNTVRGFHGRAWEVKRIRKMNLGTRASLSEVDASLYAKRVVRQYRRDNTFVVNK